jgi:hypothetical protein
MRLDLSVSAFRNARCTSPKEPTHLIQINMKKLFITVTFFFIMSLCWAQYYEIKLYKIYLTQGSEANIKNIGDVAAHFNYDSIGKNWNMKTENDYLRFKILHFYILNKRKEGEHWKKKYNETKIVLNKKFNDYMRSRLKKRNLKISTALSDTRYRLNVYFIDKSDNVQGERYVATFQFTDSKTGEVLAQYYIEQKPVLLKREQPKDFYNETDNTVKSFLELSIAMSNYFKKHLQQ